MKTKGQLRALTGIRFWAALAVIMVHFGQKFGAIFPPLHLFDRWWENGTIGVDFFFVLSGFILCHAHPGILGRWNFRFHGHFLMMRLARIYPVHVVTLGTLVLLVLLARWYGFPITGVYPFEELPWQVGLMHIFPGRNAASWNYPAWSISAEWFAYLFVFPVGCWLVGKSPRIRHLTLAPFVIMGVYAWVEPPVINSNYWSLLRVTCGFLSGCLLYPAYLQGGLLLRTTVKGCGLSFILLFILVGWRSCLPGADYGLIILPAVVLGLTKNVGLIQNWLGNRWNVFGGEISYSLYMTHSLSEKLLKILFPVAHWQGYSSLVGILIILAHFLVMLLVAVACYYAVEKPARNKIRMVLER